MKRLLVLKSLIAILIVCVVGFTAVGCEIIDSIFGDNIDDSTDNVTTDKAALNAEIALAVNEQGDYTLDSYIKYVSKLNDAKKVADDAAATQADVDKATAALTKARLNLSIRPIEEVKGAEKAFRLIAGGNKEIVLADYVNINGLSKITYEIKTSNEAVTVSPVADGKFTITAGEESEACTVKVSINVYYDGVGKRAIELSVQITNDKAPVLKNEEVVKELDMFDLANKESLILDFAENVDNAGGLELTYSAKLGEEALVLDGTLYTLDLGSYTEETVYTTFNVTVSCIVNGEERTLEYTYKLGIKDTGAYRVANGNFENGLDGWTANNYDTFGSIKNESTFWDQQFPMFNVGSYFSSEGNQGALASSYFKVNSKYATFMIGAGAKEKVYITINDADGNVLALYRNTKFADLPAGDYTDEELHAMIGNTVFACNLVTYKVDISAFDGQTVRFVIHDYEDDGGFGFMFFDELNTYYASEDAVPENAILAENLLANKDALKAELALEIKEQGDYTLDSFNAYLEKLADAKALVNDIAVTQATVDAAVKALTEARTALAVRPIVEVAGANKALKLISGNSLSLAIADYVNANGLSNITYAVKANGVDVAVTDGKFTITSSEVGVVSVSIIVSYNGEEKLTVELTVTVTNDIAPTLRGEEVALDIDVYALANKSNITLDLSENVNNEGSLKLSYSVAGTTLDGSLYTFAFGTYTDKVTYETITVTVSFVANGEAGTLTYTYKLGLKDTTANRLVNGGFENGLDGWTQVGNIGGVSSDRTYWTEAIEFGMDGDKMFSAYAPGALESAVGTLTSPSFKVGGSGFVTFKVGAMRDGNYVYVDVVDASTKQILARYYNGLWTEADLNGCKLIAYKADLSAFAGKEVFFRISDNADSGYGLFFADSFITYYETEPEGFNAATPVNYVVSGTIYDVFNGGFEMGDVQGWWNNGEIGVVTNANGYWGDNIPYDKVGDYLFTGVESNGADTMREGTKGTLTSSVFEIGGTGYISFKLGGGGNDLCYVQIIDAVTGEILARYHQQAQQDAKLIQYVADLSAYVGRTARIQVVDYATSGWGCVSFDNVVTYYPAGVALPEGAITANNIFHGSYNVTNGSFETGNLDGWNMNIWEAGAHNTLGHVVNEEHSADWYINNNDRKDGNYLMTFVKSGDAENCENTRGELVSSTFALKQNSFVSFKFGAAHKREVRIELVRADGEVIARFYNEANGRVNTEMYTYFYQYTGETADCFFRVVDDANCGPYGCFVIDDFRVNLESAPEGSIAAIQ